MDFDNGAKTAIGDRVADMIRLHPAEDPIGLFGAHVDATMTHGRAEILMPVGAVKGMPLRGKKGGPGNAGQDVIIHVGKEIAGGFAAEIAIAHVLCRDLIHNGKFSGWGGGGNASAASGVAGNSR